MDGIHDCGGMDGFGPVRPSDAEPVFRREWQRRVFGLVSALDAHGFWNQDKFRHAIERMPAGDHLAASYYERWLSAVETLLIEKAICTKAELTGERETGRRVVDTAGATLAAEDVPRTIRKGLSHRREGGGAPRWNVGGEIVTGHPSGPGHTRLPRYARGRRGTITHHLGLFLFNDRAASGHDEVQHLYIARFPGRELWGSAASANDSVCLSLWEPHIAGPASRHE